MRKTILVFLALCIALLCTACGDEQLDFTGKTPDQVSAAIKGINKKITDANLHPTTQGPSIACLTWLADSTGSPILMEQSDIRKALQALATAKGNDGIGWVLVFLNETGVDKLGNKSPVLAVKLAWDMATLKKVNWENIEDWQLTELAGLEGLGPFGKNAIAAYCKEGRDTYGIEFCKRAGY